MRRFEWCEGDVTALPFAEATFDLVCRHHGLQFFPDRSTALREMRRVLVPGGRLALGDAPALRALIAGAGFREIHIRLRSRLTRWPSLEDYVFGYLAGSPMAPAVAALDDTARNAMLEHITTSLQSYVDNDGLAAPWESHVVTAHT